jgi:glycosyltransferase involved in cell wall biosynthesis
MAVYTIPFGVDLELFKPLKTNALEDVTIGIVKKLEKKYGIDYLIRAFAQLPADGWKIKLLIVGDGSEESSLRQLCQSLHIERRVHFAGFVAHNKVPDYLNKIDIFVVPSIQPSETFGVAAVEAAACGIPVIASNIGGLPEVVVDGQTGFLVPPKKPEAIADKIMLLIKNIELRDKMGASARKFVEQNYLWEKNAAEMEKLYLRASRN